MTSHAAVVARGMGKPCIAGAQDIKIDAEAGSSRVGDMVVKEGDWISMDGATGKVILGKVRSRRGRHRRERQTRSSAGPTRSAAWACAPTPTRPRTRRKAREFGAEGIGLCRTEHMFMQEERLPHVRNMIMAETLEEREKHLAKLLPFQREDFEGIFRAMAGLPVTIRLLDPPLHEFLPNYTDIMVELERMRLTGAPADEIAAQEELAGKVKALREANPMLGTRGCRLGIQWPEIYAMQVRAIIEAACDVLAETGEHAARGDHDPAGGLRRGIGAHARAHRSTPPKRCSRSATVNDRLQDRHDDRGAARRPHRRRDRRVRRLLQLRHQRPHPDDAGLLPRRRRGQVPDLLPQAATSSRPTPSRSSTRTAWAS